MSASAPAAPGRSLAELSALSHCRLVGDGSALFDGVASLEDAGPTRIAFFHNPRYRDRFQATLAGAVVVSPEVASAELRPQAALLVSDNPYLAFGRLSALFHPPEVANAGRHPGAIVEATAWIHPEAEIRPLAYVGAGAWIGARTLLHPGAVVLRDARVGEGCVLYPCAVVREACVLGDRVILQPGAVVGSDGFGYAFDPEGPAHVKVPQVGIARLEADVELGAGACVDRATLGETVVGRGTKIDNLVQLAHNVRLGAHCLVCAQAGVAGSSELGNGVVLGGQVGVIGHLRLGDGVRVGAQSGVMNDVPAGEAQSGSPARGHLAWLRSSVAYWRLPELLREQAALRRRVLELERRLEG